MWNLTKNCIPLPNNVERSEMFWYIKFVNSFVAERESVYLDKVTKDDVIKFYNKYVKIDAPNRAKMAVYVLGKNINNCKFSIC